MKMGTITEIKCRECGLGMAHHICPAEVMLRCETARRAGSESRSGEWVEELAQKWERTIAGWNEEHLQDCEYHKGYARAIKDILKDLLACAESSSTPAICRVDESNPAICRAEEAKEKLTCSETAGVAIETTTKKETKYDN